MVGALAHQQAWRAGQAGQAGKFVEHLRPVWVQSVYRLMAVTGIAAKLQQIVQQVDLPPVIVGVLVEVQSCVVVRLQQL